MKADIILFRSQGAIAEGFEVVAARPAQQAGVENRAVGSRARPPIH